MSAPCFFLRSEGYVMISQVTHTQQRPPAPGCGEHHLEEGYSIAWTMKHHSKRSRSIPVNGGMQHLATTGEQEEIVCLCRVSRGVGNCVCVLPPICQDSKRENRIRRRAMSQREGAHTRGTCSSSGWRVMKVSRLNVQ